MMMDSVVEYCYAHEKNKNIDRKISFPQHAILHTQMINGIYRKLLQNILVLHWNFFASQL